MKLEQQQQQQTAMEVEEWPGIHKLGGVQDLLDQNKLLITEINQNHAQQTPESLMRNVLLIKQLNSNMARVVQLYTDIAGQVDVAPGGLQGDPQQQQQGQPSQAPSQQQQQQQDTAPRPGSAGDAQAQHGGHSVGRR